MLVQSQSLVSNRFFVFPHPKHQLRTRKSGSLVAPKHCWVRRKNRLRQGLWPTRRQKLWTAIFEMAAKYEHVGFAMFGCRCRFATPWTSIATQCPPLLIVCLGMYGMDRRCADRSVRGIGVLRERLESRRLFILLDLSHGALVCCVPIGRSVCVAPMHLEVCYVWPPR